MVRRWEAHGGEANSIQSFSLPETLFIIPLRRLLGNERAVSRICCPLVSCSAYIPPFIHSLLLFLFLFSLPTIHPSCIFPILPSHPTTRPSSCIPISEAYCFQSGCIIRLGDSDATPRRALASQLRHPIFLVSRLPTAWLSIAPGRPDTGTHTHLPHTPIHSYIHSDITPTTYDDHKHSSGEETQANRHPTARRIRLRAQTSDKVPRKSDYKEQRNTPSATRHYTGTVITQHGTTRLDSTRHSIT